MVDIGLKGYNKSFPHLEQSRLARCTKLACTCLYYIKLHKETSLCFI